MAVDRRRPKRASRKPSLEQIAHHENSETVPTKRGPGKSKRYHVIDTVGVNKGKRIVPGEHRTVQGANKGAKKRSRQHGQLTDTNIRMNRGRQGTR